MGVYRADGVQVGLDFASMTTQANAEAAPPEFEFLTTRRILLEVIGLGLGTAFLFGIAGLTFAAMLLSDDESNVPIRVLLPSLSSTFGFLAAFKMLAVSRLCQRAVVGSEYLQLDWLIAQKKIPWLEIASLTESEGSTQFAGQAPRRAASIFSVLELRDGRGKLLAKVDSLMADWPRLVADIRARASAASQQPDIPLVGVEQALQRPSPPLHRPPPPPPPPRMSAASSADRSVSPTPSAIRLLAALNFAFGLAWCGIRVGAIWGVWASGGQPAPIEIDGRTVILEADPTQMPRVLAEHCISAACGLLMAASGFGLWSARRWGRMLALATSAAALLFSIWLLVYFTSQPPPPPDAAPEVLKATRIANVFVVGVLLISSVYPAIVMCVLGRRDVAGRFR